MDIASEFLAIWHFPHMLPLPSAVGLPILFLFFLQIPPSQQTHLYNFIPGPFPPSPGPTNDLQPGHAEYLATP